MRLGLGDVMLDFAGNKRGWARRQPAGPFGHNPLEDAGVETGDLHRGRHPAHRPVSARKSCSAPRPAVERWNIREEKSRWRSINQACNQSRGGRGRSAVMRFFFGSRLAGACVVINYHAVPDESRKSLRSNWIWCNGSRNRFPRARESTLERGSRYVAITADDLFVEFRAERTAGIRASEKYPSHSLCRRVISGL